MEKLEKEFIANGGEWKEYRIGKLFKIETGSLVNNADLFEGEIQRISAKSTDNGIIGRFDTDYLEDARHYENFISVNFFGDVFYHPYRASVEMKVHVLHLQNHSFTRGSGLYISAAIRQAVKNKFGYGNQLSSSKLKNEEFYISLPSLSEQLAFSFMERYIEELEAERIEELEAERIEELEAYLEATGLKNYALNTDDVKTLDEFEQISSILPPPPNENNNTGSGVTDKRYWAEFSLLHLFGESTRGKRLKSFDRIAGDLPFVTAGEKNTGISDFIGNEVEIFKANTTTIDMFGSAKYRNYCYGADDHVAVIHTEKLNKHAALFTTAAIHKAAHTDKFSYSNNFYASDADDLYIFLPSKNNEPDYAFMERFMQAVQKLVIKDIVVWTDKKIEAYKKVIG